jgi:hypothetical protein
MIRRIGLVATIATVAGLALAAPGPASAATTLGSTFVPTGNCGTDTTYIQTVSGGQPYSAPYSGVITSWSFQPPGTEVPTTIKLKVGRVPPGADLTNNVSITIIGESAPQTPSGSGLNTFPTRIPVQAGDDIGIYVNAPAIVVHSCNFDGAYTDHFGDGDIAPGTTETFTGETFHHDVSAMLEPDADHDGFGDETQDQCPTNASTQGPCPVSPASATGQRAAALKKCKKNAHKKHWTKKRLKKCKRKAKRLPV